MANHLNVIGIAVRVRWCDCFVHITSVSIIRAKFSKLCAHSFGTYAVSVYFEGPATARTALPMAEWDHFLIYHSSQKWPNSNAHWQQRCKAIWTGPFWWMRERVAFDWPYTAQRCPSCWPFRKKIVLETFSFNFLERFGNDTATTLPAASERACTTITATIKTHLVIYHRPHVKFPANIWTVSVRRTIFRFVLRSYQAVSVHTRTRSGLSVGANCKSW